MNIQEMATAVQYNLPIKVVILNNGYLGMVRQWQEFFYDQCYSCTEMDHQPDFVKLADIIQCDIRITSFLFLFLYLACCFGYIHEFSPSMGEAPHMKYIRCMVQKIITRVAICLNDTFVSF